MEHLGTYLAIFLSIEQPRFVERHPEGFLLLDQQAHDIDIESMLDTGSAAHGIQTGTMERPSPTAMMEVQRLLTSMDESAKNTLVFRLVKQAANQWQGKVSVGRARNNDIVLPAPSISKVHAVFQRAADGTGWKLTDVGSRNGTSLNGVPLAPNEP